MSNEELKYPQWQTPLQEAILEFDRKKLREKLEKVKTSILERLLQLHQGGNGQSEREAINDALATLRVLNQEKLDYPDWK
jgi:hypothetical protein